ncbi:MAG: D-alanine--D-alanine ligase [Candidatus Omnitrophica bacterium]|nr:D-alanine--D-alanine ligase [Candidatus Omnitrophota bacterium]
MENKKIDQAEFQKKCGKIGILMGGPSSERDISLKSGSAVYEAFSTSGFETVAIDIQTDNEAANIVTIEEQRIACAFIALHGRFGEDGGIQSLLDRINVPYSGSGVDASRLAMDKSVSSRLFAANGLHVAQHIVLEKDMFVSSGGRVPTTCFDFPLVVKPAKHGSSIGLSIVTSKDSLAHAVEFAFAFDEVILIEEYIKGRELTVGILDDRALPPIEIVPAKGIFDYEAKYSKGMTEYVVPASLPLPVARKVQEAAEHAHRILGCFGYSRVDIILREDNIPFVLEVNTIPGLTQTSLLPKAARVIGIDFLNLCMRMLNTAFLRSHNKTNVFDRS